jgi:hypothetical protein
LAARAEANDEKGGVPLMTLKVIFCSYVIFPHELVELLPRQPPNVWVQGAEFSPLRHVSIGYYREQKKKLAAKLVDERPRESELNYEDGLSGALMRKHDVVVSSFPSTRAARATESVYKLYFQTQFCISQTAISTQQPTFYPFSLPRL